MAFVTLFVAPVTAPEAIADGGNAADNMVVAEGLPNSDLRADLRTRQTRYLDKLIGDPAERATYLRKVLTNRRIEAEIAQRGLQDDQRLLEQLRAARERLLLETLVFDTLTESKTNIREVARERYLANPDEYKIRKKIKIAVIFISKSDEGEQAAEQLMETIVAQLEEAPDDPELFHALAKTHSDDLKAADGGKIDEWLIAPRDLEARDPLMQAVFALERIGEITPVIETTSGYSIAKLMDVTPESLMPFAAVASSIEKEIQRELFEITRAELYNSLSPGDDLSFDDEHLRQTILDAYELRAAAAAAKD